jgi:glycosyltransferase involved in cell wall biosynthesis
MDLSLPGKHASFYFWETDRLPEGAAKILSNLDEVWAPSTFVAEVLQGSGVTTPIVQISPPIDTGLYSPGARRTPPIELPGGFDPSWTVFLYVGTWDPRKRPDLLVRSFSRAFSEEDRALLLIKSYVTGDPAKDREILGRWIDQSRESNAHIRFIPEILSTEEMAALFRFASAFATASRGEGYCLPAVQAMSCGKPVIAAGWSAFKDYVSVPVDYAVQSIPREISLPGYSTDQHWAAIDGNDLSRKLRWVHANRDQARTLGKTARDWVFQNASISVTGQRLRSRIQELSRSNVRPQPLEVLT